MVYADRAGPELSKNYRNVGFGQIFDQFKSGIFFDFQVKMLWKL